MIRLFNVALVASALALITVASSADKAAGITKAAASKLAEMYSSLPTLWK